MFLFFNRWGGDNNPLPDGLIYEGVSEQPIRVCDNLFVCLVEPKVRTTHPCTWQLICLPDWAQSQTDPSVCVTNDLSAWLRPKRQRVSNNQPQLLPSVTQPIFLHLPFTRSLVHSLFQYHVTDRWYICVHVWQVRATSGTKCSRFNICLLCVIRPQRTLLFAGRTAVQPFVGKVLSVRLPAAFSVSMCFRHCCLGYSSSTFG